MSTQGVGAITIGGITYANAAELAKAVDNKQLNAQDMQLAANYLAQLAGTPENDGKGTTVQSANDGDKARPAEERLKNEGAIRARYNAIADELSAAVFSGDKARIDAATSKMQAFKNKYGNFDPTNARQKTEVEAATLKETAKQESRGSTIRVLGDAENSAKDIDSHRTATTTVAEVKSKKQRKQEIKADASYTDR